MKFGAELVPYYKTKKLEKLAKKIEEAGFDHLWVADHYHNRFVHSVLSHLADVTDTIQLGPGVTNPYLVHPSVTAAAIATLDEISEGRANLGISAGDPSFLNSVGIEHDKPITAVREAILMIRKLLDGEKVNFSGEEFSCSGAKLRFNPPHEIPIYVGGRGHQMMNMAGAKADGALINASHPKDLRECLKYLEEGAEQSGKNLRDFDKVAYMATSIDQNEEKAQDKARTVTSFVAASAPDSAIEREGISKGKINEIRNHLMNDETGKARKKLTEKMIDTFSVSGPLEKLEDRIETLREMGITQVVIGSPIGPDTRKTIEKIGELID